MRSSECRQGPSSRASWIMMVVFNPNTQVLQLGLLNGTVALRSVPRSVAAHLLLHTSNDSLLSTLWGQKYSQATEFTNSQRKNESNTKKLPPLEEVNVQLKSGTTVVWYPTRYCGSNRYHVTVQFYWRDVMRRKVGKWRIGESTDVRRRYHIVCV
jgi:hypothetical protein